MRADLALYITTALYLLAGYGVLLGLGAVRVGRRALLAAGLAYLAGVAAVTGLQSWLLVLGLGISAPAMLAVALAVGMSGTVIGLRRHGREERTGPAADPGERWRPERIAVAAMTLGIVVIAVVGLLGVGHVPLADWDGWSIWARKGTLLFDYGTIPTPFWTDLKYSFMHQDYPLMIPILEANWFRVAGVADTQAMHIQMWLLLVAFVGSAAWIVGRRSRAIAWLPILLLLLTAGSMRGLLLTAYADVPMALFLGLGALLMGRFLESGDRVELALSVLMLATAANTKNEGTTGAFAVIVAAIAVSLIAAGGPLRARLRTGRPVLVAAGAFLVTLVPWRAWLAAHGIEGDIKLRLGIDPTYLFDRTDRLGPAWHGMLAKLADQGAWSWLLPLGAAAALTALFVPALRRAGAFYLIAGALTFAVLLWAYWISALDIAYHVATSVDRVVVAVILIGGMAALHIVASSAPRRGQTSTG